MNINTLCDKIEEFEGFRAQAYLCPAGVPTIGFGRTASVSFNEVTTIEKEREWLHNYVSNLYSKIEEEMKKYGYNFNKYQLFALTDFAFNLGFARLYQLTASGSRTPDIIAMKILEYDKATVNGAKKSLPGLAKRRKWEYELFTSRMPFDKSETDYTAEDIQELCNKVKPNLNKLKIDGIIGQKTINRLYMILYDLL